MSIAGSRFKYVGGGRKPLGRGGELFRNPMTGVAVMMEKHALAAASTCRHFATIEAHAASVQALLGAAGEPADRWASILRNAVADGVLMSAEDVAEYVLARLIAAR